MRIVVLGNCQAHGIAHGLAHLLPDAFIQVAQIDTGPGTPRGRAATQLIQGCDMVFAQPLGPHWGALRVEALAAGGLRVARVPRVLFNGYHPDVTYLKHQNRTPHSPVGVYHSSIVAAAFCLGVPEADVPTLFNRLVYARLGHFDAFGKARTLLAETLAPFGPRFAGLFESWHARGPFMHTVNHPRVFVLADVARAAAIAADLLPETTSPVTPAFDHLAANTIWPVYPEIADRLGVPGGMVFKRAVPEGGNDALHLGLPALIRASYALYRKMPAETFRCAELAATRSALAAFLGLHAG